VRIRTLSRPAVVGGLVLAQMLIACSEEKPSLPPDPGPGGGSATSSSSTPTDPMVSEETANEPRGTAPEIVIFVERNGYPVPQRWQADAQLPDACLLLTAADPKTLLKGPFAPIQRMSNDMCIIHDEEAPQLERSISVEVRRPDEPELVSTGHIPRNRAEFWAAEDFGIGLVAGHTDPKELNDLSGLGDYAVWYTIYDGMALHAYWDDKFILAINVRGPEVERGLAWAKEVAKRAIEQTRELNEQS